MLEGAVMEYAKWFIGMVSVMFITVAVVFMFRLNELNTFQQEINYQIERNGGLTQVAMKELNNKAKDIYGGCIAKGPEDNAPCLFPEDRNNKNMTSSGFFIHEYKVKNNGAKPVYYNRGNVQARYGTKIDYVVTRQIGAIENKAFFKPAVVGTSASRVRGTSSE